MKWKALIILSLITFLLTGCFDLGEFGNGGDYNAADPGDVKEYYKQYYDSIGDIYLLSQDLSLESYSLEDSFFSTSTINYLTWEKSEYEVESNEYIYMAIEIEKDLNIDSLSLYMKGETGLEDEVNVNVYMYILDRYTFSSIPNFISSLFEEESEDGTPKRKTFDFMDKTTAIGSASITINSETYESFTIDTFNNDSDNIIAEDGQYIILSFYNNTAYGREENLKEVAFTALNLLIRAE